MSKLKVLLVDDDAPILKALNIRFQHSGFEVHSAKDPISALNIAVQEQPDVAILDINLPGIDGFALAEKVQATRNKEMPIVFMSASRAGEVIQHPALGKGANFYAKPFDTKLMIKEVTQLAIHGVNTVE